MSRTSSSSALSHSPDSDSASDTGVDLVYRQAVDFISFTEQLKREMSDEQSQQKRLTDACVHVTECLESMRLTVDDLRARTAVSLE